MGTQETKYKLIMFDMDGTLLNGRSIFIFSEKLDFKEKLVQSLQSNTEPYEKSIEIAGFLKGMHKNTLLDIFHSMPLHEHVEDVAQQLHETKIATAIITDSYQFIADDLKNKLSFDYAFANNLKFENNIVTGDIEVNNSKLKRCETGLMYSICKEQILESLCNSLGITPQEVIAVGDGQVDIGMIKKAGLGIAIHASEKVKQHADVIAEDIKVILKYIDG